MSEKSREIDIHLGLAALILGICMIIGANNIGKPRSTVSVRGLCEREVMADRAIYPISYKESGNDLENLFATVQKKNEIIRTFLKQNGFSDDEITIGTPKLTDRLSDSYSTYSQRYTINSVVSLCTDKVSDVIKIQTNLSSLLEQGVAVGSGNEWENPIIFEFAGLNNIKPEMIEEANHNARAAADQFAKDSESKVGKIKEAIQGLFSIENRDANTPHIKRVRVITYVTYYLR